MFSHSDPGSTPGISTLKSLLLIRSRRLFYISRVPRILNLTLKSHANLSPNCPSMHSSLKPAHFQIKTTTVEQGRTLKVQIEEANRLLSYEDAITYWIKNEPFRHFPRSVRN